MVHFQNTYTHAAHRQTMNGRPISQMDWSSEITPEPETQGQTHPASDTGMGGMRMSGENGMGSGGMTQPSGSMEGIQDQGRQIIQSGDQYLRSNLPMEVIEAPLTADEAYRGSMKAKLAKYVGSYVVATFLVGTQSTVSWEGILYDVGNDFLTIYQEPRDRYIVTDIYSLKYIEFYDTRRREMCEAILRENGLQNNN